MTRGFTVVRCLLGVLLLVTAMLKFSGGSGDIMRTALPFVSPRLDSAFSFIEPIVGLCLFIEIALSSRWLKASGFYSCLAARHSNFDTLGRAGCSLAMVFQLTRSWVFSCRRLEHLLFKLYRVPLLLFCAVILIGLGGCKNASRPIGPRIGLPFCSAIIDLGEGDCGGVKTGLLPISNSGGQDLRFSVLSSCACGDVAPKNGTLRPGEKIDIRLNIRLKGIGSEERIAISIESNDLTSPSIPIVLKARVPAPFKITPYPIQLSTIASGQVATKIVEIIRASDNNPPHPTDFVLESTSEAMSCQVISDGADKCKLKIEFNSNGLTGPWSGFLRIRKQGDSNWLEVPVSAFVQEDVCVSPKQVKLELSQSGRWEANVFVWKSDSTSLGQLVSHSLADRIQISEETNESSPRRLFRICALDINSVRMSESIDLIFASHQPQVTIKLRPPTENKATSP